MEILALFSFSFLLIFWGMKLSIQAPFFPIEATRKGASVSQIGPVFGIYQVTSFLVSPFVGKCLHSVGIQWSLQLVIFLQCAGSILFGCLTFVSDLTTFLVLAYILRILEGVTGAFFYTSSQSLLLCQYSDRSSAVFAFVEGFYCLGSMVGPVAGSFLYNAGGFSAPFLFCGSGILVMCGILLCAAQQWFTNYTRSEKHGDHFDFSVMSLLYTNGIFPSMSTY